MSASKYSDELADKAAEMYALGKHRIKDITKAIGINKATWYDWKENHSYFSDSLKKAKVQRLDSLLELAHEGLQILLTGCTYKETTNEYEIKEDGTKTLKSNKTVKKKILPSVAAVIFACKNLDSNNFPDGKDVDKEDDYDVKFTMKILPDRKEK